jgi:regulator of RNase E activity RraA
MQSFTCGGRAIFGSLVAKFLLLYRQVEGIVVQGSLRDIPHLLKENWPIWCEGRSPIGCFNRKNEVPMDPEIIAKQNEKFRNAVAVCDDSGVVVITQEYLNDGFLDKLKWIEEREDIWFDCIDRLKKDTYDTVCLKNYKDP